jgi:hypothetical protein
MRSLILQLLFLSALVSLAPSTARAWDGKPKASSCGSGYGVVDDDKGTIIKIAVHVETTEEQLKSILQRVADCRQDDPERDYLLSNKLEVWAFLKKGRQVSVAPAGKIFRFLPAGNVPQRKRVSSAERRKKDVYTISLLEARNSLKP